MQQLKELFREWCGSEPQTIDRLPGAGSNRVYYRLTAADGRTVIGCVGTSREENHAFVTLARHFRAKGLPVPEVLAVSDDEMRYLQQDLGGTSLFDALRRGREAGGQYNDEERQLLRQAIALLPRVQFAGADGLDFSVCYPQPAFDETGVMFDLNYFKYCFLKPSGVDFHELRLEEDFRRMAADLVFAGDGACATNAGEDACAPGSDNAGEDARAPLFVDEGGGAANAGSGMPVSFLYRDFQARNIMISEEFVHRSTLNSQLSSLNSQLYLIDFQGGRRGPFYYDLASFLWQASARYPQPLRQELLDVYYAEAQHFVAMPPRPVFDNTLRLFVLFRLMQVLGAYGFRGYFERKQHFIDSIPPALDSLRSVIRQTRTLGDGSRYPYMLEILDRLTERSSSQSAPILQREGQGLVVSIFSFSYKKGIPQDESGNGGGYVFDCRAPHNPGRYERYKKMTGLDQPVIEFLEKDGEITTFLESVYRLADAHVARYVERGFTSLMFCFGCTGGQHRSVYSAQHLAEHIHRKFPMVKVRLCHREQGISTTF